MTPKFSKMARRQLRALPKRGQRPLIAAIHKRLIDGDPRRETANKLLLRRSWNFADYELRAPGKKVFYRVMDDGQLYITLIGVKRLSRLLIDRKEFEL